MRPAAEHGNQPLVNRERYAAHTARLTSQAAERQQQLDAKKATATPRAAPP